MYGQSVTAEVVLVAIVVVEIVPQVVDDGGCTSMTPGRMFTVAMVTIPVMHIVISMTNHINNL